MERHMERLDRMDWINAGLAALSEAGLMAVRVELLAKRLNITKGSFYWHFSRREELLSAMLVEWERAQTTSVVATVEGRGGSPHERLLHLSDSLANLDLQLEAAMRSWAASDFDVCRVLERVDSARLVYLQSIIESAGVPTGHAKARARLVYFALIGELTSGGADWFHQYRETMDMNRTLILSWPQV